MATFTSTLHGERTRLEVSEALTNYGSGTRLAIETIGKACLVEVKRVKLKRSAGTAATFTPRIYGTSSALANSVDMQFAGSSTAVADLFDVATTGVVFKTDAVGKLYLEPGPVAGADNAFDIDLVLEVL